MLRKHLKVGAELTLAYRQSTGVQEYSNIKTGDDGEMRVGVKIPVIQFAKGINQNKLNLQTSEIDAAQTSFSVDKNLREFYFNVYATYYQALYRNELFLIHQDLLNNAQKRNGFLKKRIYIGDTAPIVLTESMQLINEREQKLNESRNDLNNALQQLSILLNLEDSAISDQYELPLMQQPGGRPIIAADMLDIAKQQRLDLKILDLENKKITQESLFADTLQYPDVDLSINGVHDNSYNENGVKVSVGLKFPIERNKYYGKRAELLSKKNKNNSDLQKSLLDIRKTVMVCTNNLATFQKNYDSAVSEIDLAKRVENAASRQFELGQESLFVLNQRELKTLQTQLKKCEYNFKYTLAMLELEKETGKFDGEIRLQK